MTVQQLKKEINELKNSIISKTQPAFKVVIFNEDGLTTTEGLAVADVEAYSKEHPNTQIIRLRLANFRKA